MKRNKENGRKFQTKQSSPFGGWVKRIEKDRDGMKEGERERKGGQCKHKITCFDLNQMCTTFRVEAMAGVEKFSARKRSVNTIIWFIYSVSIKEIHFCRDRLLYLELKRPGQARQYNKHINSWTIEIDAIEIRIKWCKPIRTAVGKQLGKLFRHIIVKTNREHRHRNARNFMCISTNKTEQKSLVKKRQSNRGCIKMNLFMVFQVVACSSCKAT